MRANSLGNQTAFLTANDLARMLQVTRNAIYQMKSRGRLPLPVRIGRLVRWREDDIFAWVRFDCPPLERFEQLQKATLRTRGGRAAATAATA